MIFANSCTGTVDETCSYGCVENYEPVESSATAICLLGGAWNRGTDEFCKSKWFIENSKIHLVTDFIPNTKHQMYLLLNFENRFEPRHVISNNVAF